MAAGRLQSILGYLRTLTAKSGGDDASDRALLERFAQARDEAAFAALVERHGGMVYNVCVRVLQDEHAAEDAFQAVFIVLARKSSSLLRQGTLAGWLFTVAHHAALKARSADARRRARERQVQPMPPSSPSDDFLWRELSPLLDEEVRRLPERYRAPFVLCCLEGKTNEEAARLLGCPTGTVLSRLSRARERLRAGLTRRGVTLTSAALGGLLAQQASAAVVPPPLVRQTIEVALPASLGPIAACTAATIATGVIRTMIIAKLTQAAIVTTLVLGLGGGLLAFRAMTAAAPDLELDKAAAPTKAEIDKAQAAVKAAVGDEFKSATLLDAPPILRTFPGWLFFDARFTYNYGVPLGNIEGSSCWAVNKQTNKAIQLGNLGRPDQAELKKFFESNLPEAKNDAARKDALWACLRIAQEAYTDHKWIEIKLQDSSINVAGKIASGKSVVTPNGGNAGELVVTVNDTNRPASVDIASKIRMGPRPICQATRLLDADPIIRAMAEQQLLLIGARAADYLAQRRAEAGSAELRAAIDAIGQRIRTGEQPGKLVQPERKLLDHPERIVRDMTRQQLRLLGK